MLADVSERLLRIRPHEYEVKSLLGAPGRVLSASEVYMPPTNASHAYYYPLPRSDNAMETTQFVIWFDRSGAVMGCEVFEK